MSVGGTNQLLQCGECGHWSGEAAPATSLVSGDGLQLEVISSGM